MNKKWKAKWIRALRSGKYRQAKGVLHNKGAYCCLGVLRHLMHPGSGATAVDEYLLCQMHATNMNDSGKSFEQIADDISAKL